MKTFKQLDKSQAWEKIRHFCSYQERCHREVMEKLFEMGMDRPEAEQLASRLVEENYLNEERFAVMYAGGHFRVKKWGRVKIRHALKQKGISAYCLKKALAVIDEGDYYLLLEKLATEKWRSFGGRKEIEKKFRCRQFLLQRGFESGLIDQVLKEMGNKVE